ncbi:MAG: hypothetical protein ACJAT7_002606 [Psychromonas sp.]|jgi:hypothetical protein|uniref:heme-binding beta-barrel domain-containing protein n=1 Tax=Psychromonas sp. TaxID=1884585 RepID=UPI0039E55438
MLFTTHYLQKVQRIGDNTIIHQESGYWMWDQATNRVMHSLTIPRGRCVLAGGTFSETEEITFDVQASIDQQDWQLIQSPFIQEKFKMTKYSQQVVLAGIAYLIHKLWCSISTENFLSIRIKTDCNGNDSKKACP